jgi:hypothetical protein
VEGLEVLPETLITQLQPTEVPHPTERPLDHVPCLAQAAAVLLPCLAVRGQREGSCDQAQENLSEEDLTRRIGKAEKSETSVFEFGPGTLLREALFQHRSETRKPSRTAGSLLSGKSSGPHRKPLAPSLPLPQRLGRVRRGDAVLLSAVRKTSGKFSCAGSQLPSRYPLRSASPRCSAS